MKIKWKKLNLLIDIHGNFYAPRSNMPRSQALNDAYLSTARKVGITHIVGIVMGTWGESSHTYVPSLDDMKYGNRFLLSVMEENKGFVFGYAYINPAYEEKALEELEFCIRKGMIGMKLGASVRCDSRLLDPLVEKCIEHNIPILQHVSQRRFGEYPHVALSDAADLARLAKRFPEARFIQAHVAGGGDWQFGLRAAADVANIWIDLSGSGCDNGLIEFALSTVGEDRLLFATDLTLDTGIARLYSLEQLGANIQKISYLNAQKVYGERFE
jgi:predicted TIM-barrel fold metal-dependent hydrolase